jgi:hypothetical protein
MAIGPLDIVNVLNTELPAFGVPQRTLATLCGISSGRLSAYLSENRRLEAEDNIKLRRTWASLKRIIELARPLKLDLSRPGDLGRVIEADQSGHLLIIVNLETNSSEINPAANQSETEAQ